MRAVPDRARALFLDAGRVFWLASTKGEHDDDKI